MSGSFVLADANTSGLTPCSICAASMSEPANDERRVACGNCCSYVVNASFREAAAETVRFGLPPDGAPDPDVLELLLPQPARASTTVPNTATIARRFTGVPFGELGRATGIRPSGWSICHSIAYAPSARELCR